MSTSYTALESGFTSTLTGDQTLSTFNTSSLVSFGSVINSLWIISLSFIAVLIFWYGLEAAMLKTVGGQKNFNESNNIFERLGKSLFYAFAIYIVLLTLNPGILKSDISFQGLKIIGSSVVSSVSSGVSGLVSSPGMSPSVPGAPISVSKWEQAIKDDPAVRDLLKSENISVNKSVCSSPTQTNCTTVGGLPTITLDALANLRKSCPGNITVTGGTEAGHQTHGPGLTPVDISLGDQDLNSCISKFPKGSDLSFCYNTYLLFGFVFCNEANSQAHWHVYR